MQQVIKTSTTKIGYFRMLAVVAAAVLAASFLLALSPQEAEAAFPGDNGKIVFTSNRTTGAGVDNPTADYEIFSMNPDGTSLIQLTHNNASDTNPAWSPDGTEIAFHTERDGNAEIYKMNSDGSNQTNLTNNPAIDNEPAWSPDGTNIAFTSNRDDPNQQDIYRMASDGSAQVRLTKSSAWEYSPAWSPDGTKLAFVSDRSGNNEIHVMKPSKPEGKRNRPVNLTKNSGDDQAPNWSPDGKYIAFYSSFRGVGNDPEIYKMKADGTDQVPLTENQGVNDYNPTWSPDATKIAFTKAQPDIGEIHVMNANGSNPQNLSNNPKDDNVGDWQPIG